MIINGTNVTNFAQAAAVEASVAAGSFGGSKSETRLQINGQLEAFYVFKLLNAPRTALKAEVADLNKYVGVNSRDPRGTAKRALARVKAARGKNAAFTGGTCRTW